jgi:hypothetical protein
MPSNLLTIDQITREAQMVLHQKLNFVTNIVTEYDDQFAKEGAKIGNTLRLRLPMMYNTGTGATMTTGTGADSLQNQVTLTVNTQRHVPMRFTSNEMTMKIDDFRERHLEPAMSKLAAMIEADALSMIDQVAQEVAAGTKVDFADIMDGRAKLGNALADTDNRHALLDVQANADLINELKGLFQDSSSIAEQYKEGAMGRTAGFKFYENTLLPGLTNGTEVGSAYLTNQVAAQAGSYTNPNSMSLIVDTGTKTVKKGQTFNIEGVYDVHPETKATRPELKQFTVLANFTGAGTISISPAIIASGPYKNVSNGAANDKKLIFHGTASQAYRQSLLFQKGFAVFGTADLVLPPKVQASRIVHDGISMRLVKDWYNGVKDQLITRFDVLYGYKVLRPQLAVKILHT